MAENLKITSGSNYTSVDAGSMENLHEHFFHVGDKKFPGKLFLKDVLGLTGMEISLNKLPSGAQVPWSHKHVENEELYLFLKGNGQFYLDGEILEVGEGTAVRVAPDAERVWRNHSTEDLFYICIQAKANSLGQHTLVDGKVVQPKFVWPE